MASEGQAKISLILELKNRMSTAVTRAKEHLNSNIKSIKDRLHDLSLRHTQAFSAMSDAVPGLSQGIGMLANPYVAAAAAVVALGAAYAKCVSFALDWRKGMAEVNVTAGLSKDKLDDLSKKLIDIGTRNVAPLEDIPATFNKIISAGLNVNQSLAALEPTLRAAKAGFTDTTTVAMAGVAVMKSSGEDINKVYDVLFATLNKGNATFADIANYLPKIVPDAKNLGFSLGEVGGAFAYMTAQGQTAEASTTLLQNVFKAFGRTNIRGELEKIGVSVFDSQGKIRPFISIIDELKTSLSGLTDEQRIKKLESLGLDGEASRGLAAMVQNPGELKSTIEATSNSDGALDKAYTDALTPMDTWLEIGNKIKGGMKSIGDTALPKISMIGQKILDVIKYFKDLYSSSELFRDSISLLGTVVEWSFKIAMAPIRYLWNMLKWVGQAIGWVVTKLFGFSGGIEEMYATVKPYLVWIKEMFDQIADIGYKAMTLDFKGAWDAAKNFKMPDINEIQVRLFKERWVKTLAEKTEEKKVKEDAENPFSDESVLTGAPTPTSPGANDKSNDNPVDKITAGASQQKNITINIDSFVKGGINTAHTNMQKMNAEELEQWMSNMFMRLIRNAEMSM